MTREELEKGEVERTAKRTTITVASANVLSCLDGLSSVPDEVLAGARTVLETARQKGDIRAFRVHGFGTDLLIQASTFGRGLHDPAVHQLIFDAIDSALSRTMTLGMACTSDGRDFSTMSREEKTLALGLIAAEFPYTERQSEPILIAKIMNGGMGAFNRMLFNLFFHPDKGSHQRLDGTRFIAVVEHAADAAARRERRVYVFGDRPEEETLFLLYPCMTEPLEVHRQQVGDWGELLSLVADPSEWVVSAIYAVKGRFVSKDGKIQSTRHEPVTVVSVEPALPGIQVRNPVAVLRLQSGLPAVGEAHFNLGADFHFIVGGPGSGYHVGVMPVTIEQARSGTDDQGTGRIVAYTYQSYENGRIPPDHDVVDVFAQDSVQTEWLQAEADRFIRLMVQHGEFQPYLTADEAERRARERAGQLETLFKAIPSGASGELDPLVARANERSGGRTISDIKADGGGKVGHTTPPTLFRAVAEASLREAKETGLLLDSRAFGVGDDLQLVMLHERGVDSNEIHVLAFRTFWRMVWVTELVGYKPYSLAQDLQIGPATKGRKVDDLAEPTEGFVELLAEYLPEPERSFIPQIRLAERAWKQGRASIEVKKPFAGNVTGQGPGFAELPLRSTGEVGLLAADKSGPAAFNIPVFDAVQAALKSDLFRDRYGKSMAFEIWDVHRHTRIFLDAFTHTQDVQVLLGATNLFNVKRVWSLRQTVPRKEDVESAVEDMLLAASTERLALITGGQYVGKDDPVLMGVAELVVLVFESVRTRFSMTQGDERGSHYMALVPKPVPEAIATVRSRGLCAGLLISPGPRDIVEMEDAFSGPSYREARVRIDKTNASFWRAQGSEFTPVGVGARDVEPAYPLMKVLHRLTAKDSSYGIWIRSLRSTPGLS